MWAGRDRRQPAEPTWVKVAHALLTHGPAKRQSELWPSVRGIDGKAMSKNACSDAVDAMAELGLFMLKRPVRFGPGMGLMVGVSIGTESMRGALFDANGELVKTSSSEGYELGDDPDYHASELPPLPDQLRIGRDDLVDRVASVAHRVALRALADRTLLVRSRLPLLGVSVAWPTPIGRWDKSPRGRSLAAVEWRAADPRTGEPAKRLDELIADRLDIPLNRSHAINDANAIAIDAAFRRCRQGGYNENIHGGTILGLRLGGGVGAGTVVIGTRPGAPRSPFLYARLLEGSGGFAGELGHFQVAEDDIEQVFADETKGLKRLPPTRCACGRNSCLETYASAASFVRRLELSGVSLPGLQPGSVRAQTSVMRHALSQANDDRQIQAQKDIGNLLSRCLLGPVLMLNPDSITISGSLAVDAVEIGMRQEQGRWAHPHFDDLELEILKGQENRFAPARGAALVVFRQAVYRRFDDPGLDLGRLTLKLGKAELAKWA